MSNNDLRGLPGPLRAEVTRLRAEREVLTAERERLRTLLDETESAVTELTAERDRLRTERSAEEMAALRERVALAEQEAADRRAEADALRQETSAARAERDTLRAELAVTRDERDSVRLRLLDAELALAGRGGLAQQGGGDPDADRRVAKLADEVAALSNELDATKATVSWRVTAPLRAVRRRTPR
ncbi:hypothetical protein [Amycolatopsis cihanbeyliensis]|uniref:Uncharacterized protein n=1 Tax=Amycolatopsis cihanbeyliensis TaxID=1128664 RepID=A0A542DLS9_AMYCI|nr:hypothetical protein [Amycolatopsis cihanbeyliensis]TQJ04028.1 hypothetical protein FB471_3808 [Amycolatopsis cihanbeyliensis]